MENADLKTLRDEREARTQPMAAETLASMKEGDELNLTEPAESKEPDAEALPTESKKEPTLSDLVARGCDLGELREQPEEMLAALGFSPSDRDTLVAKLKAMPADLPAEALVAWAAQSEAADDGKVDPKAILAQVEEAKAQGNEHFKAKRDTEAIEAYQRGIGLLATPGVATAPPTAGSALLVSCHTNAAACHVRLEQWEAAVSSAASALAVDATNVKALFRRGVACSRLGRMAQAKADLTAVVRADPKNRDARTVLEVVVAALKEEKESERARLSKAFSSEKGLYAAEEARERKRNAEEAQRVVREEEALKKEWRQECEKRRAEQASGGGGGSTMQLLADAAKGGDAEASEALDKMAPISFADWKAERKAREEKEKKAREEDERKRRVAAKASKAAAASDDDDDEDDLKGVIRGYKKRADGSTTSYFTREVDPATKALLDAQKAPKRLDPQQAAAAASGGAGAAGSAAADGALPDARKGSAWNAAGTWEEKDLSSWAQQRLKPRLAELKVSVAASTEEMEARITAATSDAASASDGDVSAMASALQDAVSPLLITVKDVKKCEGSASVQSSRGKTKHLYDLTFEIEWEGKLQADDKPAAAAIAAAVAAGTDDKGKEDKDKDKAKVACKGVLTYAEVTSSAASADEFEVEHRFKKAPAAKLKARADSGVALLRAEIVKTIEQFSKELRLKTISA